MRRPGQHADGQTRAPRLVVDPVACDGIGICVHLAPDLVVLDRWGFPIIGQELRDRTDLRAARAAVAGCPRRAMLLRD